MAVARSSAIVEAGCFAFSWTILSTAVLCLDVKPALSGTILSLKRLQRRQSGLPQTAPLFGSLNLGLGLPGLGSSIDSSPRRAPGKASDAPDPFSSFSLPNANGSPIDLQNVVNGGLPGLAPIPVPGFPGPQDLPAVPGVNTIPGLDMFNYLVGTLIPQAVPPANQLLGGSLSRLLPQDQTKNLARNLFQALAAPSVNVEVDRMMGRWFQVINSPHVIREACTVSHYGALTNNSYSATFTILKFFREGNPNGSPRFALGYGFKAGENGTFVIHNSNNADAEPYWVIKTGPLNEYNQYDYAIISNWVKFPVLVQARDPERFTRLHIKEVLNYLEENGYINIVTKALSMVSPVDYSQCQYTPTFSSAGR